MPYTLEELESILSGKTERCVVCWKDTGIKKSLPIYHPDRKGCYVSGAGQTCEECRTLIDTIYVVE